MNQEHVPDAVYEHVRQHFTDEGLVHLTMAIIAIKAWNPLAIGFRVPIDRQVSPPRDRWGHSEGIH